MEGGREVGKRGREMGVKEKRERGKGEREGK